MRRDNTGQQRSNDVMNPGVHLSPGIPHFKERTCPGSKRLPNGKAAVFGTAGSVVSH